MTVPDGARSATPLRASPPTAPAPGPNRATLTCASVGGGCIRAHYAPPGRTAGAVEGGLAPGLPYAARRRQELRGTHARRHNRRRDGHGPRLAVGVLLSEALRTAAADHDGAPSGDAVPRARPRTRRHHRLGDLHHPRPAAAAVKEVSAAGHRRAEHPAAPAARRFRHDDVREAHLHRLNVGRRVRAVVQQLLQWREARLRDVRVRHPEPLVTLLRLQQARPDAPLQQGHTESISDAVPPDHTTELPHLLRSSCNKRSSCRIRSTARVGLHCAAL